MARMQELLDQREKIDTTLNDLITQGELGPDDQRGQLGQSYSELYALREGLTSELNDLRQAQPQALVKRAPGTPAPAPVAKRKIRWGVLAVGGTGILALLGLIGWQVYNVHARKKTRRKKRKK